jgi:hypothetical protein
VDDIQRSLGRVEGKLDLLLGQMAEHHREVGNVDSRLAQVEAEAAASKKAAGVLGAVAAGIVTVAVAAIDPITKLFK